MSDDAARADRTRRRFLLLTATSFASGPIARVAIAQGAEKLDENSPPAKALDYHDDATKVTNPKRKKDQFCHNCQFFQGTAKDQWGACPVFQNKVIAANGWCSTWVAKA